MASCGHFLAPAAKRKKYTMEQWEQNSRKEAFSPPQAFNICPKGSIPSPHHSITPLPHPIVQSLCNF
jgi:hypothetical protein